MPFFTPEQAESMANAVDLDRQKKEEAKKRTASVMQEEEQVPQQDLYNIYAFGGGEPTQAGPPQRGTLGKVVTGFQHGVRESFAGLPDTLDWLTDMGVKAMGGTSMDRPQIFAKLRDAIKPEDLDKDPDSFAYQLGSILGQGTEQLAELTLFFSKVLRGTTRAGKLLRGTQIGEVGKLATETGRAGILTRQKILGETAKAVRGGTAELIHQVADAALEHAKKKGVLKAAGQRILEQPLVTPVGLGLYGIPSGLKEGQRAAEAGGTSEIAGALKGAATSFAGGLGVGTTLGVANSLRWYKRLPIGGALFGGLAAVEGAPPKDIAANAVTGILFVAKGHSSDPLAGIKRAKGTPLVGGGLRTEGEVGGVKGETGTLPPPMDSNVTLQQQHNANMAESFLKFAQGYKERKKGMTLSRMLKEWEKGTPVAKDLDDIPSDGVTIDPRYGVFGDPTVNKKQFKTQFGGDIDSYKSFLLNTARHFNMDRDPQAIMYIDNVLWAVTEGKTGKPYIVPDIEPKKAKKGAKVEPTMTKEMVQGLMDLGFTADDIVGWTPKEAIDTFKKAAKTKAMAEKEGTVTPKGILSPDELRAQLEAWMPKKEVGKPETIVEKKVSQAKVSKAEKVEKKKVELAKKVVEEPEKYSKSMVKKAKETLSEEKLPEKQITTKEEVAISKERIKALKEEKEPIKTKGEALELGKSITKEEAKATLEKYIVEDQSIANRKLAKMKVPNEEVFRNQNRREKVLAWAYAQVPAETRGGFRAFNPEVHELASQLGVKFRGGELGAEKPTKGVKPTKKEVGTKVKPEIKEVTPEEKATGKKHWRSLGFDDSNSNLLNAYSDLGDFVISSDLTGKDIWFGENGEVLPKSKKGALAIDARAKGAAGIGLRTEGERDILDMSKILLSLDKEIGVGKSKGELAKELSQHIKENKETIGRVSKEGIKLAVDELYNQNNVKKYNTDLEKETANPKPLKEKKVETKVEEKTALMVLLEEAKAAADNVRKNVIQGKRAELVDVYKEQIGALYDAIRNRGIDSYKADLAKKVSKIETALQAYDKTYRQGFIETNVRQEIATIQANEKLTDREKTAQIRTLEKRLPKNRLEKKLAALLEQERQLDIEKESREGMRMAEAEKIEYMPSSSGILLESEKRPKVVFEKTEYGRTTPRLVRPRGGLQPALTTTEVRAISSALHDLYLLQQELKLVRKELKKIPISSDINSGVRLGTIETSRMGENIGTRKTVDPRTGEVVYEDIPYVSKKYGVTEGMVLEEDMTAARDILERRLPMEELLRLRGSPDELRLGVKLTAEPKKETRQVGPRESRYMKMDVVLTHDDANTFRIHLFGDKISPTKATSIGKEIAEINERIETRERKKLNNVINYLKKERGISLKPEDSVRIREELQKRSSQELFQGDIEKKRDEIKFLEKTIKIHSRHLLSTPEKQATRTRRLGLAKEELSSLETLQTEFKMAMGKSGRGPGTELKVEANIKDKLARVKDINTELKKATGIDRKALLKERDVLTKYSEAMQTAMDKERLIELRKQLAGRVLGKGRVNEGEARLSRNKDGSWSFIWPATEYTNTKGKTSRLVDWLYEPTVRATERMVIDTLKQRGFEGKINESLKINTGGEVQKNIGKVVKVKALEEPRGTAVQKAVMETLFKEIEKLDKDPRVSAEDKKALAKAKEVGKVKALENTIGQVYSKRDRPKLLGALGESVTAKGKVIKTASLTYGSLQEAMQEGFKPKEKIEGKETPPIPKKLQEGKDLAKRRVKIAEDILDTIERQADTLLGKEVRGDVRDGFIQMKLDLISQHAEGLPGEEGLQARLSLSRARAARLSQASTGLELAPEAYPANKIKTFKKSVDSMRATLTDIGAINDDLKLLRDKQAAGETIDIAAKEKLESDLDTRVNKLGEVLKFIDGKRPDSAQEIVDTIDKRIKAFEELEQKSEPQGSYRFMGKPLGITQDVRHTRQVGGVFDEAKRRVEDQSRRIYGTVSSIKSFAKGERKHYTGTTPEQRTDLMKDMQKQMDRQIPESDLKSLKNMDPEDARKTFMPITDLAGQQQESQIPDVRANANTIAKEQINFQNTIDKLIESPNSPYRKIESLLLQSSLPEGKASEAFADAMYEMGRVEPRAKTPTHPDPKIQEAIEVWRSFRDSVQTRQTELGRLKAYVNEYFPLIPDMQTTWQKIKYRWNSINKLEDIPEVLKGSMTQTEFDEVKSIISSKNYWDINTGKKGENNPPSESLTHNQRNIIRNRVLTWIGVHEKFDYLPSAAIERQFLKKEKFNPHLQERGNYDFMAYKHDGLEVVKQFIFTMARHNMVENIRKDCAPRMNNYEQAKTPGSIRHYMERQLRTAFGERTPTEKTMDEMVNWINRNQSIIVLDPRWEKDFAGRLVGGFVKGALGVDTAVRNLTQQIQTVVDKGPSLYLKGLNSYIGNVSKEAGDVGLWKAIKEGGLGEHREAWDLLRISRESFEETSGRTLKERLGKEQSKIGKTLAIYEWFGDRALEPMRVTEHINKAITFLTSVGESQKRGYGFDKAVRIGMNTISDQVAPIAISEAYWKAYNDTLKTQYGYTSAHRSPLLRSPIARLSTIFWSYPANTLQFMTKGLKESFATGDRYRFARFCGYLGLQLTAATALAQVGIDASNVFGFGILPISGLSAPWQILYNQYNALHSPSELDRDRAQTAVLDGLATFVVPQYRFGKKVVRNWGIPGVVEGNIERGYRVGGKKEIPIMETNGLIEFLDTFGAPPIAQKRVYEFIGDLQTETAQQTKQKQKWVADAAKAYRKGDMNTVSNIMQQARDKQIPLSYSDITKTVSLQETSNLAEQKMKVAPKNIQGKFQTQYNELTAKNFPSGKHRSMWSSMIGD